jgi:GNAT superfamily N-acetyltransferase
MSAGENEDNVTSDVKHQSPQMRIRRARANEGERLREIARAAKGYWRYDPERVDQWIAGLDVSPEGLGKKEFYVADVDGRVVGWSAIIAKRDVCWLDDLWIEPERIGRRVGTCLFRHAVARARELGAARIEFEAERHAIGFYEKRGARSVRDGEPGVWGRVSPIMALEIADAEEGGVDAPAAEQRARNVRESVSWSLGT